MKIAETNLSKGSKSFNPEENQEVDTCCDTAPIFNLTFNDERNFRSVRVDQV